MNVEAVEIKDGDVIVVYGLEDIDDFAASFHERYPKSLIVALPPGARIATMEEENLRWLLESLLEHMRAKSESAS